MKALSKIKFSVVLTTYSGTDPKQLSDCLQSLALQTKKPNQLVVCFDGRVSDEIFATVQNFIPLAPFPTTVLSCLKNYGPGVARNIAVSAVDHDWFAIMDSDDKCAPDRFKKQAEIARTDAYDVIGGLIEETQPNAINSGSTRIRGVPLKHEEIRHEMKRKSCVNNVTAFIRKSSFSKCGGYPELRYGEDYLLWYRMLASGAIFINIPDVLVTVKADQDFFTRRRGWEIFKREIKYLRMMRNEKFITKSTFSIKLLKGAALRSIPTPILSFIYKCTRK